jgi:hypothetical protein
MFFEKLQRSTFYQSSSIAITLMNGHTEAKMGLDGAFYIATHANGEKVATCSR